MFIKIVRVMGDQSMQDGDTIWDGLEWDMQLLTESVDPFSGSFQDFSIEKNVVLQL